MEAVPALVTLHVWGVPARRVPRALLRMATDRRPLRHTAGLGFAKLLGTGRPGSFDVRDGDPRRWALLACWSAPRHAEAFERSPVARGWRRLAEESCRLELAPVAARGRWSGRAPFGDPAAPPPAGPVVALTRARLAPRTAVTFWRAVPPVAAGLGAAGGLRLALGIGEAPIGFQGTVSVWDSPADLHAFAYAGAAHRAVIRRTAEQRWYAEELYARFRLLDGAGTVAGTDPLRVAR